MDVCQGVCNQIVGSTNLWHVVKAYLVEGRQDLVDGKRRLMDKYYGYVHWMGRF